MKLEMRDVARDEDEIERAFTRDLVGDVEVAAPCVLNVRDFQGEQCPPRPSSVQCPKKGGGDGFERTENPLNGAHLRLALRPLCNPSTEPLRRQAPLRRPTSAENMRKMSRQP
jgi:hypothetical protein